MAARGVISDNWVTLDELGALVERARAQGFAGDSGVCLFPKVERVNQLMIVDECVLPDDRPAADG